MEENVQKKLSLFDKFGILLLVLDTYFEEVSAPTLLKAAIERSFRDKKSNLKFLGYF